MRQFIRAKGEDYLRDPNISSIGIGYKITDGASTPQIAVQFTVNDKQSAPEALAALGTTPVPASITIGGVEVPTDVLARRYEPGFQVVPEPVTVTRKPGSTPSFPGSASATSTPAPAPSARSSTTAPTPPPTC